jgi:flavin reductase (DIM6/NTAB) family NADH-FMN oxidoreductase RutF
VLPGDQGGRAFRGQYPVPGAGGGVAPIRHVHPRPSEEKFAGLEYRPGQLGLPVLSDAMAQLECTVVHAYPGGDHMIFVAQVESGEWSDDAGKEPLLYFRGKYSRLHP